MKLEKFTFRQDSPTIEKLIYFVVAITFVAPLMASIICFSCFTFLGLETSQDFRYLSFGICELCAFMSFLITYQ